MSAWRRPLQIGSCSYKSIESILRQGLDRQALPETAEPPPAIDHENIRGADYYQ
jgi:hypothetical protein